VNIQALKRLPRKQWLIIVASLTVVLAGFFVYLLAGSLARLGNDEGVPSFMRRAGDDRSLFAQIAARQASIADQISIAGKLDARKAVLEGMKADIEAARKRLPTEAQKAEVRQLIEDLARQVGSGSGAVTVKSVSIREAAQASGRAKSANEYQTIEYQTQVSADMDGVIQFINLIERNQRFMTVEGIQLSTGGVSASQETGKIGTNPHSVQLRIVTYIDASGSQMGGKK